MTGEAAERKAPAGAAAIALLVGLATLLAWLWRGDPLSSLLMFGVLTAAALRVLAVAVWPVAAVTFVAAVLLAFAAGDVTGGAITAAAVFSAGPLARLQRRFVRDDDQFFLAPLCFWLLLGVAALVGWVLDASMVRAAWAQWQESVARMLALVEDTLKQWASAARQPETVYRWEREHLRMYGVVWCVFLQTLIAFGAIRMARASLGQIDPLAGRFMRFRVHERYSLLLILGLALLVAAPLGLRAAATPLLAWFGTGCFLAGFASALFVVDRLRQSGRWMAARTYLLGTLLILLLERPAFAVIGLVDVWFDIRRLTPKRGDT